MKKKLLLHTCCAPCSTHCVKELLADYDVVMYFYNPNVHPYGEYIRRLGDAQKVGDKLGVELVEGDYDVDEWLSHIAGFEEEPEGGKRCGICFSIRLGKTAEYAKKNGFDLFTTTMSISPHKNSKVINSLGEELAKKHGVSWVHSDFKKKDGFKRSTKMSKKLGLYRQKYCGCFYSVKG
ncbi:epoxyqueuosine reductase QueH [Candidatus Woesearchaeota archaeon]|nr:epoxyqueuosine reductase QueH [Candidatus Woesearchaeota archaeon]